MRRVYPGFVQLGAFMSMNIERHVSTYRDLYEYLRRRRPGEGGCDGRFYEEYLAVNDLPAEFYLETVPRSSRIMTWLAAD